MAYILPHSLGHSFFAAVLVHWTWFIDAGGSAGHTGGRLLHSWLRSMWILSATLPRNQPRKTIFGPKLEELRFQVDPHRSAPCLHASTFGTSLVGQLKASHVHSRRRHNAKANPLQCYKDSALRFVSDSGLPTVVKNCPP